MREFVPRLTPDDLILAAETAENYPVGHAAGWGVLPKGSPLTSGGYEGWELHNCEPVPSDPRFSPVSGFFPDNEHLAGAIW